MRESSKPVDFQESDVRNFFRLIQQGDRGKVIELRALDFNGRSNNIFSGYFDQEDSFVNAARQANQESSGVYCTVNHCNPQLLARRANRAMQFAKSTTSDGDILRRQYLPIDLDPQRPAGTSSSDEQHEASIKRSRVVFDYIKSNNWNEPLIVDSGNGAHLLLPFYYPNDENSKVLASKLLKSLASRFNDSQIKVDESVFNAARIMRLAGTMNRKGDNLPKYPHRPCRILHIPDSLKANLSLLKNVEEA